MPIFEYTCNKCGMEFEALVFGSRKVTCSKCGAQDVKKRLSTFAMSGVDKPTSSGCSSCSSGSCSSCK